MLDYQRYMMASYKSFGRGPNAFDCWGAVRDAGHKDYGWPLFESFGHIEPSDKSQMTEAVKDIKPFFVACDCPAVVDVADIERGIVIEGFSGRRSIHVGLLTIADNQVKVFHASSKTGLTVQTIEQFKAVAGQKIRYWQYVG